MKKVRILAATIAVIAMFLTDCSGGEEKKIQGAWQAEGLNINGSYVQHFIFKGNEWILLRDGLERSRGTFEAGYETSKENTYIIMTVNYVTVYQEGYPQFAEKVSAVNRYRYVFKSKNELSIENVGNVGTFTKATIPSSEMRKIEDTFKGAVNNPDMRNTEMFKDRIYSTRFPITDIREIIKAGSFEGKIGEKEIRNGTLKDGVFYWTDDGLGLFPAKGKENVLNNGDGIVILLLKRTYGGGGYVAEDTDDMTMAKYTGENVSFKENYGPYGLAINTIYCALSFDNGNPVLELQDFVRH
jgi:hypothetical protein